MTNNYNSYEFFSNNYLNRRLYIFNLEFLMINVILLNKNEVKIIITFDYSIYIKVNYSLIYKQLKIEFTILNYDEII